MAGWVQELDTEASNTSGTTLSLVVPAGGVPAGSRVVVRALGNDSTVTLSAVDDRGNTYTVDEDQAQGTNVRVYILSAHITTPLQAGDTIDLTYSAAVTRRAARADEYDGLEASGAVDQSASNTDTAATALSSGVTGTTTQTSEVVVAAFAQIVSGTPSMSNLAAGYSTRGGVVMASTNRALLNMDKLLASTGTQEATFDSSLSGNYAGVIVTYKVAGGDETLSVGKATDELEARGVTLAASGSVTLGVGKATDALVARGLNISAEGATISVYRAIDQLEARGVNVTGSGSVTLGVGKATDVIVAKGVQLTNIANQTLSVGKATDTLTARGVRVVTPDTFVSLGAGLPDVEVTLALEDVGVAPSWRDITAFCRAGTIDRGREDWTERTAPGILNLTLDNTTGIFDRAYTAGPYYPNLVPRRRIRVRFRWDDVIYPAFLGYTEGFPQSWPKGSRDSLVQLVATDYFLLLEGAEFVAGQAALPAETSDARFERVLDLFGTAAADRVVDTAGTAELLAVAEPSGSMLDHVLVCMESENGFVFVDKEGKPRFQGRRHRPLVETAARATFVDGDSGAGLPYTNIVPAPDDVFLYNHAKITPGDGAGEQEHVDDASKGRYGPRTYTKSFAVSQHEALGAAQWVVWKFKEPQTRFESVELQGGADPDALWPVILDAELSYRYLFKRTPESHEQLTTQEGFVERIHLEFEEGKFDAEWKLTPYGEEQFWVLGDAVASVLGDTTQLTY